MEEDVRRLAADPHDTQERRALAAETEALSPFPEDVAPL
jgi:hypothetical protein